MRIGLVAHDDKKEELLEWADFNKGTLSEHTLIATGTTGTMLAQDLQLPVEILLSGPKGGDQQIGAKIANKELDTLIFFWDPESSQPHEADVKALLRLATLWNVPYACNTATADMIISSILFASPVYEPVKPNFEQREVSVDENGKVTVVETL